MKRGDIYWADLNSRVGSEQCGKRPVLVIQNNVGNNNSPTTIVASITTVEKNMYMPTHVVISTKEAHLPHNSVVMLEQLYTISKERLLEFVSQLSDTKMKVIDKALKISLSLGENNDDTGR